jgi:hypothetical protein
MGYGWDADSVGHTLFLATSRSSSALALQAAPTTQLELISKLKPLDHFNAGFTNLITWIFLLD